MEINKYILSTGIAIASLVSVIPAARAFNLYLGDPTGFSNSLTENSLSTIVDNNNNFASDPAAATSQAKLTRSGTINSESFVYDIYDVNFADTDPLSGSITPGSAGGDILETSTLEIEAGATAPVSQDGASGNGTWGIDSAGSPNRQSSRNAAIFDFTTTPSSNGIGHFGLYLHDLESDSSFRLAEIRLYDDGVLTYSDDITWTDNGDGKSHFLGVAAEGTGQYFDQVVIAVGDDNAVGGSAPGKGYTEAWAADEFTFGQAYQAEVPFEFSPTLGLFCVGGFWLLNQIKKNRSVNY